MISRISRSFVALEHFALPCTCVASCPPSKVAGHCALTTTAALFVCRWCDAFVFVTSWKPAASSRRPVPWQLGQVVVSPNEFPMRRSPPQMPHVSSPRSELGLCSRSVGSLIRKVYANPSSVGPFHSIRRGETLLDEENWFPRPQKFAQRGLVVIVDVLETHAHPGPAPPIG